MIAIFDFEGPLAIEESLDKALAAVNKAYPADPPYSPADLVIAKTDDDVTDPCQLYVAPCGQDVLDHPRRTTHVVDGKLVTIPMDNEEA